MFFTNMTFIGVDPSAGEKPIVYCAIDQDCRLLALSEGSMDEVLAFSAGQHHAALAVCAPRSPNSGVMADQSYRARLNPSPAPGRWENCRLADYLLRQRHIFTPLVLSEEPACPGWMRQGFFLFRKLIESGYQHYPNEFGDLLCLEVYPHAAFCALSGVVPYPKTTLEGRLQRQLLLFEHDLKIPDPMNFFEEITRHRLLKGSLPLDDIYSARELDTLVGAFTAWMIINKPEDVIAIGEIEEGQVIIPVPELKPFYE